MYQKVLLVFFTLTLISSCGQKGALYLPENEPVTAISGETISSLPNPPAMNPGS